MDLDHWMFGVILLPLLANLVKDSVSRKWQCWKVYRNRLFNLGDYCILTNPGNGEEAKVKILRYSYKLFSDVDQVVEVEYEDKDRELFYLLDWGRMRKKTPYKVDNRM